MSSHPLAQCSHTVAPNASARPLDVVKMKSALKALGFYDAPEWGVTPYPDAALFDAIKTFQQAAGIKADGVVKPDGETEAMLSRALNPRAARTALQETAQALQAMGRGGDEILAHITPEEAALLHTITDGGSINPQTGLMEFYYGGRGGQPAGRTESVRDIVDRATRRDDGGKRSSFDPSADHKANQSSVSGNGVSGRNNSTGDDSSRSGSNGLGGNGGANGDGFTLGEVSKNGQKQTSRVNRGGLYSALANIDQHRQGLGGYGLATNIDPDEGEEKKPQGTKSKTDYSLSEEEEKMARAGNVKGFWQSRKAKQDPIATIGMKSLNPPGGVVDALFGGKSVNDRLEAFSRVYAGKSVNIDQVRGDLVEAHSKAVKRDTEGRLGLLDPGQVYDYHKDVFAKHGLPSTAFGGTPFTGQRWESYLTRGIWCSGCDD